MSVKPDCRFCLDNALLVDTPILSNEHFYMLGSIDPMVPVAGMLIPRRHSETPFEMSAEEWSAFGDILNLAKAHFDHHEPDGFTLGWNVGAAGGQHVFHTHLHIVPRFKHAANAGMGVRHIFRTQEWPKDA